MNSDYAPETESGEQIGTDWTRFGIGSLDGVGYYGSSLSFVPYVAQNFTWTKLLNYDGTTLNPRDTDIMKRYEGAFRFGDRAVYGFKTMLWATLQLDLNYETNVVFPRYLFGKWLGSFMLEVLC